MNGNKTKTVKALGIVAGILFLVLFPGCIPLSLLMKNGVIFKTVMIIACALLAADVVTIIVLAFVYEIPIMKPTKEERFRLTFEPYTTYGEFKSYLEDKLLREKYIKCFEEQARSDLTVSLYINSTESSITQTEYFTVIRTPVLEDDVLESARKIYSKKIAELGLTQSLLQSSVSIIELFCVDNDSPTLKSLTNSNIFQGRYSRVIYAGLIVGENIVRVARQKGGQRYGDYKILREKLINTMDLKSTDEDLEKSLGSTCDDKKIKH